MNQPATGESIQICEERIPCLTAAMHYAVTRTTLMVHLTNRYRNQPSAPVWQPSQPGGRETTLA